MINLHLINSTFVLFSITVVLIFAGTEASHAKDKPWVTPLFGEFDGSSNDTSGFRPVGDRSGTIWISSNRSTSQTVEIEAVKWLSSETEAQSSAPEPTYISRNAEDKKRSGETAMISWPVLLFSALASLLVWASLRRRTT